MRSKRYKKLPEKTFELKPETIDKLLQNIKKNCTTKFNESIDVSLFINVKQKKGDVNLRTVINLPEGTGKKIKVGVVCEESKQKDAKDEIKSLVNFSGEYKSDILINECLCGNISQYKKIISELYINTINQIFLLRILSNKIHRLLKMKEQKNKSNNIDNVINTSKPPIFWKEKPLVKKQLSIWSLNDLRKIVADINDTELLCKKNPQISKFIFISFFSSICKKASNYS